jgi:hypothetical protein|tara:strand:- start:17924 stop:18283 length:360 start_codon:yes stop_codon:yes gene_type:complete
MKTEYCPHCGAKHTYEAIPPKFCSSCGQGLASSNASAPITPEAEATHEEEEVVPQLTKLEYSIETGPRNKVSIGDLLKEGPSESQISLDRPTSNATTKEHLENSVTECQTARRQSQVGE